MSEEKQELPPGEHLMRAGADPDAVFPRWLLGSSQGGISKREYFAAMAMMGLMDPDPSFALSTADLVAKSVETADALIAELG